MDTVVDEVDAEEDWPFGLMVDRLGGGGEGRLFFHSFLSFSSSCSGEATPLESCAQRTDEVEGLSHVREGAAGPIGLFLSI